MTEFIYKNRKQLEELGEECFGLAGNEEICKEVDVLIYLIAYRLYNGKKVNQRSLDTTKRRAKLIDFPKTVQIFFEKAQFSKEDDLYFLGVIRKIEKRQGFCSKCSECIA